MQKKFLRALLVATAITSVSPLYASVSDDFLNQADFMGQATAQAITSTQGTLKAFQTDINDADSAPVFPHTGIGSDADPFVVNFPLQPGLVLTGDPSDSQTIVGAVNYMLMEHTVLGENIATVNAQRQLLQDQLDVLNGNDTVIGSIAHRLADVMTQNANYQREIARLNAQNIASSFGSAQTLSPSTPLSVITTPVVLPTSSATPSVPALVSTPTREDIQANIDHLMSLPRTYLIALQIQQLNTRLKSM